MTDMKHANVVQFTGAVVEPPELMIVWEYCTKGGLQVYHACRIQRKYS